MEVTLSQTIAQNNTKQYTIHALGQQKLTPSVTYTNDATKTSIRLTDGIITI